MKLDLTVEEVNLVLLALSKLPFDSVNQLIPKIQEQGNTQLTTEKEVEDGTTV
jgi:hypothetical protein